ncbi:MAG TPA: OmpH family outer membrane protein [Myxococcales bacterium]|nr:OmpH family outer membrane protein [Myxococcales bacterium]
MVGLVIAFDDFVGDVLMAQETKTTKHLTERIRRVIDKMGDKDNLSMVLNLDNTVLYYKRHQDITDKVIKAYNKLYAKK